jgi:nucleotide-binding universal stress UspA family protein
MYEKILVPLDGSETSEVSLPYAEELAGRLGSALTLLYVIEQGEDLYKHMHQFYMQKMSETVTRNAQGYTKQPIQVNTVTLKGNPADKIVEYANNENFGLIVMATHGRSGMKRLGLGSVAEKVVRATKKPVALIRAKGEKPDVRPKGILNRILLPLDGSKPGEIAVPYVAELASRLNSEITLIQAMATGYQATTDTGYDYVVYSEQQMESFKKYTLSYLNTIASTLKEKGITVNAETVLGNAAEEIIDFAEKKNFDLVAMSTHGRSGFGRWIFGSVAAKILHQGTTPLLLVREQPE